MMMMTEMKVAKENMTVRMKITEMKNHMEYYPQYGCLTKQTTMVTTHPLYGLFEDHNAPTRDNIGMWLIVPVLFFLRKFGPPKVTFPQGCYHTLE